MSGTTSNYGWVFPSEGDAPDGAAQMQTIAVAADSTVHGIDVRVATLEGHDANKPPVAYGASGTFTATQAGHAVYLKITVVNGGGGAGGTAAVSSTTAVSGAGAGGAGAVKTVAVSGLTFPLAVTVGAGGSGGAAGNNAGATGGTSKVVDNNGAGSTLCSAGAHNSNQGGGGGASSATAGSVGTQGFDGTTTGAVDDYAVPGGPANKGVKYSGTAANGACGGNSMLGFGGYDGANATGHSGFSFGGGGGGHATSGSTGATAGASGAQGIVIIEPIF